MRRADATAWSGDANITRWLIDSEGAARGAYPGAVIGVRKMVVARSRTLFARRQPSLKQAHDHCDHDDHPSIPSLPASPAPRGSIPAKSRRGAGGAAEPSGGGRRISLGPSSLCGSPNREGAGPQIWGPAELGPSERIPRRPARKARSPDRMLRHRHHAALPHSRGYRSVLMAAQHWRPRVRPAASMWHAHQLAARCLSRLASPGAIGSKQAHARGDAPHACRSSPRLWPTRTCAHSRVCAAGL